jgi:hypothetical protein
VNWFSTNKDLRVLFNDRLKGEAYGLRALFLLNLLQAHAGYSANGELLGVPIITEALEPNSDFSKQRNTFAECIQQIYTDLAEAEKYLPLDYANVGNIAVSNWKITIGFLAISIGNVFLHA